AGADGSVDARSERPRVCARRPGCRAGLEGRYPLRTRRGIRRSARDCAGRSGGNTETSYPGGVGTGGPAASEVTCAACSRCVQVVMYSSFYRRSFVIATVVIMSYLLARVLEPLGSALGWAAVLAFMLLPLHEHLTRRLKGRGALSAGILTGLA